MKHFDWSLTIKPNLITLRIVGLWPKGDQLYKFDAYMIYAIVSVIFFIDGAILCQIMHLVFDDTNLETFTGPIFVILTQTLGSIKIFYFIRYIGLVKSLMVVLRSDVFQPRQDQLGFIKPVLWFWRLIYWTFWSLVSMTAFLWSIYPVLDGSYKDHSLPFLARYPYNTRFSPLYEMTYCHQVVGLFFVSIASLNIDTLISALMMYIGTQSDILCDNLKKLQGDSNVKRKITYYIKHHKKIISFAQGSNNFLNLIALGQFFTTSVSVGLAMFQLSLVSPFSNESFSLLFYVCAVTVQLLMYCWFGNDAEFKSSQIPYSAFESDWTGIPLEAKKNLLIFIMRAQRPIKMSAINLFSLSLSTFTTILRTSWSYFAVLRQVNAQD